LPQIDDCLSQAAVVRSGTGSVARDEMLDVEAEPCAVLGANRAGRVRVVYVFQFSHGRPKLPGQDGNRRATDVVEDQQISVSQPLNELQPE
jgi:hypothetical protein